MEYFSAIGRSGRYAVLCFWGWGFLGGVALMAVGRGHLLMFTVSTPGSMRSSVPPCGPIPPAGRWTALPKLFQFWMGEILYS